MNNQNIKYKIKAHNTRNQELLLKLKNKGVDINDKISIECHFWAWTQKDAALLGKALYEKGFLILMINPAGTEEDPNCWNIEAGTTITPKEASEQFFSEELIKLAESFNAAYDGWGTSI